MIPETGHTICQCGKKLVKGCSAVGDPDHVKIPICCPSGCHPVGILHTHPGGDIGPSDKDLAEIKRLNLDYLCIEVPEKNLRGCIRVK